MYDDLLDTFIERWLGRTLIVLGLIAMGFAVAGYYQLLPRPFSRPHRFDNAFGMPRLTFAAQTLGIAGLAAVACGAKLVRYFRRELEEAERDSVLPPGARPPEKIGKTRGFRS